MARGLAAFLGGFYAGGERAGQSYKGYMSGLTQRQKAQADDEEKRQRAEAEQSLGELDVAVRTAVAENDGQPLTPEQAHAILSKYPKVRPKDRGYLYTEGQLAKPEAPMTAKETEEFNRKMGVKKFTQDGRLMWDEKSGGWVDAPGYKAKPKAEGSEKDPPTPKYKGMTPAQADTKRRELREPVYSAYDASGYPAVGATVKKWNYQDPADEALYEELTRWLESVGYLPGQQQGQMQPWWQQQAAPFQTFDTPAMPGATGQAPASAPGKKKRYVFDPVTGELK